MIVVIALLVILVLICGTGVIDSLNSETGYLYLIGVVTFSVLLGALITFYVINEEKEAANKQQPTAIDVYKGKTSLKVTYIDSVATDSVVVFKGK